MRMTTASEYGDNAVTRDVEYQGVGRQHTQPGQDRPAVPTHSFKHSSGGHYDHSPKSIINWRSAFASVCVVAASVAAAVAVTRVTPAAPSTPIFAAVPV